MRKLILAIVATLAVAVSLAACSQSSPQRPPATQQSTAGNAAAPASSASSGSSGPGYTVACKMVTGPKDNFTGQAGWNPEVTVKNTGTAPMQLPNLNVVNQALAFDFEYFGPGGSQVGTAADGIIPDQSPQITTIQPGDSAVFTFNSGTANQASDTLKVTTCTAIIEGYSEAY